MVLGLLNIVNGATILANIGLVLDGPSAFDPEFYANNFAGEGVCDSGSMQSPIELPSISSATSEPAAWVTNVRMPTIKAGEAKISNKGKAIEISWDPTTAFASEDSFPLLAAGGTKVSDIILDPLVTPDRMLEMVPVQLHWHTVSEHSKEGQFAAAETHIVTFVGPGEAPEWGCDKVWNGETPEVEKCTAVFGVRYKLGSSAPSYLQNAFSAMPPGSDFEDEASFPGALDLGDILPSSKQYFSYVGSLTTPACTEGLRWHVFEEEETITANAMVTMEQQIAKTSNPSSPGEIQIYRHNNRPVQPLNGRTIYKATPN